MRSTQSAGGPADAGISFNWRDFYAGGLIVVFGLVWPSVDRPMSLDLSSTWVQA
ncbi:MAG: hypothetical protein JWP25_4975 [Bradyrhizobium sp.]|nr:hypothetical protein [Bradyrhizobium sp.]